MVIVSAFTSLYYNVILAWAYFYFFASFTSELPWQSCDNTLWNTKGKVKFIKQYTCNHMAIACA